MRLFAVVALALSLSGCGTDEFRNDKPRRSETSGLATNCRALIQENVDGFRSGAYTPQDAFASIERNCGANGMLWIDQ